MRKYDDFFIVNGLPIVVKNTNNPSYDFDFRKYFRCKSVVDIPDEYVLYRVGAISDDMLDGKLAEDIKVEPMMPREVHNRCAKLSDWYPHIEEYTIKSKVYNKFPSNDEIKKDFDFPIFVKGNRQTDHHKKELSVVKDIEQLEVLRNEWNKNSILFWQEVVVREYVSLKIIDDKSFPEMMPISYEFRFFVWNNRIVGYGPYWTMGKKYSLLDEELPEVRKLVETVSHKLKVPFIAVDVAKTVDDRWIVIEVNDAQESGYVGANPNEIWSNILDGYEEAINKIPKFLRKAPLKLDTREYHSYSSITEEKDTVFYMSYGSFFGGQCDVAVKVFDEEHYTMIADGHNGFKIYWDFTFPKEELADVLKCTMVAKNWEERYKCEHHILDGYGWQLYLRHKDMRIKSSGYEAYPVNYRKVMNKILRALERIASKYVPEDERKLMEI